MSEKDWKNQVCSDCDYRTSGECRYGPPPIKMDRHSLLTEYPSVGPAKPACSQFKETP